MVSLEKQKVSEDVSPVTQIQEAQPSRIIDDTQITIEKDVKDNSNRFTKQEIIEMIVIAAVLVAIIIFACVFVGKFIDDTLRLAKDLAFGKL